MTTLEKLRKLRDETEEEYQRTKDPEAWADFLSLSIQVAELEQE